MAKVYHTVSAQRDQGDLRRVVEAEREPVTEARAREQRRAVALVPAAQVPVWEQRLEHAAAPAADLAAVRVAGERERHAVRGGGVEPVRAVGEEHDGLALATIANGGVDGLAQELLHRPTHDRRIVRAG